MKSMRDFFIQHKVDLSFLDDVSLKRLSSQYISGVICQQYLHVFDDGGNLDQVAITPADTGQLIRDWCA
eukprot:1091931-Ditylum_brightwellii.AAC.1